MDECDGLEQFDFKITETELNKIKIIRPLEVGYERLPEGVTALDFIKYTSVRSVKEVKYLPEDVPRHPLFRDAAVPSRDVVAMKLKPHSKFYKQVFHEKYDKGATKPPVERPETDDYISWHLVREPEYSTSYRRYERKPQSYLKVSERDTVCEKIKSGEPLSLITGLDKLMTIVDWLNPLGGEDNQTNSEREEVTN